MATPVTGQCFCGAVRFALDAPPITVRACWCRDCQYLAAGNATINAIFKTGGFRSTGAVSTYVSTAASGAVMHRSFCPTCGTPLFSQSDSRPDLIVVRAGALDDGELASPSASIWTASAPDWAGVDGNPPNCPGQPAPLRRA